MRADCVDRIEKAIQTAIDDTGEPNGFARLYAWAAWVEAEKMVKERGYGEMSSDQRTYRSGHSFDDVGK